MKKRMTFFIAGDTGLLFRKITLSRKILVVLGVGGTIGLLAAGFLIADYVSLRQQSATVAHLTDRIARQQKQLTHRQQQISRFADRICVLKAELGELNGFEQKIRIIANIDQKGAEQEPRQGMGGTAIQDIVPDFAPADKLNSLLRELHGQMNHLDTAICKQEKRFADLLDYLVDKRRILASTPAIRPMRGGWVTSRFAYRKSPFTGRREFHHGLDIAARMGTPVMATADGTVVYSGRKGNLGNTIIIDHGHGMVTRFGHLQKCLKKYGQTVKREDVIGTVGDTGMSTGPHVHYEVRMDGVPVDPEKYILN